MIGSPDDFRSYCKKLIDYAGRNGGFIVGSSACVTDAKEREFTSYVRICSLIREALGAPLCTVIIFTGLYSGNLKIVDSSAFIFLTKNMGHDKLVICMTTWILCSYPVNRLQYNQTGPLRVVVTDNYEVNEDMQ
jgi:hypothetical protein